MIAPIDCVTHYSLMSSLNRPDRLAKKAAELGYKSLGICDYNSLSSCVQHFKSCKKAGIKPIIGVRRNEGMILAKNLAGWKNLIKIVSEEPVDDFSGLLSIADSVIFPGVENYLPSSIGMMNCHYLNKEDSEDLKVLVCSKHNQTLKTSDLITGYDARFIHNHDMYLKSPEEFRSILTSEQIYNTEKLIDSIEEFSISRKPALPKISGDVTEEEMLKALCRIKWKALGINEYSNSAEYLSRVQREFKVINDAGLSGYFLIVSDYIRWARENGILVGPGRGSSGGCLVSYLSGITNVDPIKFGLLFERFYNAGRNTADHISYPDIDTDFPRERREDVIKYITNKYGSDRVMKISTFGRLQGKSALQEVIRITGACSREEANRITKLLPDEGKISDELEESKEDSILHWVLENSPELVRDWAVLKDGEIHGEMATVFSQAIRLEGIFKTNSLHASGIIISGEKITDIAPIRYADSAGGRVVAIEYTDGEDIGLTKCDILGLAALDKLK